MFCRDLHLIRILLCSGLFEKICLKEEEVWRKIFSEHIVIVAVILRYDAFTTVVEEIKLRSLENCLEFCRKDCRERSVSELLVSSLLLHLQLMLFIIKSFSPNVNERGG